MGRLGDFEESLGDEAEHPVHSALGRGPYGELRKAPKPVSPHLANTPPTEPSSDEIEVLAGFISKLLGQG